MVQAYRRSMDNHFNRTARLGASVLINERWYYSGDVETNTAYARACLLDSPRRGEAPIALHNPDGVMSPPLA